MRNSLLFTALAQFFASLVVPFFLWATVGFGKLYILDLYHELDEKGVIDHTKLRDVQGGRFVGEWALADELGSGFDRTQWVAYGILVFCFVSGVALLWIRWKLPRPSHGQVERE